MFWSVIGFGFEETGGTPVHTGTPTKKSICDHRVKIALFIKLKVESRVLLTQFMADS